MLLDRLGALWSQRGAVEFEDHAGVWIEETRTEKATQKSPCNKRLGIGEGVPSIGSGMDLLPTVPSTSRTLELSIERIEFLRFGVELVLVPFDEFPDELGIHLLVDGHVQRLGQLV